MDIGNVIALVSGIVSILSGLYVILIGREPIIRLLPELFRRPNAIIVARVLCVTGVVILMFLLFVVPNSKTIYLVKIGSAMPVFQEEIQRQRLILQYDPVKDAYFETQLLSTNTFPTALAMQKTRETSTFYVGSYGAGIYTSNQIPEWQFMGLSQMVITQIVPLIDPSSLLVATSLGVFITRDSGHTWEHKGPFSDIATTIAVNPANNSVILVGTLNGIYRSMDGGNTWVGPAITESVATAILFVPSNPQRVYTSLLGGEVHRSDDGGNTWMRIRHSDQQGSAPLAIINGSPDFLYLGPGTLGLYYTSDAGQSWHHLGLRGMSISSIVVSSNIPGLILVGTDDGHGVFTSFDGGKTWQNFGSLRDQVIAMMEHPSQPGTAIASTKTNGLISSGDFGRTWRHMGLRTPTIDLFSRVVDLFVNPHSPDHLLAIPLYYSGIVESTDGGTTWYYPDSLHEFRDLVFKKITVNPRNPNQIALSAFGGMILESNDNANSWSRISGNLAHMGYAPVAFSDRGAMYAGPSNLGVWQRLPNKNEWHPTGLGIHAIQDIWVDEEAAVVTAFDERGKYHVSVDSGETWVTAPHKFRSIVPDPYNISLVIGISYENMLLRSYDTGESWDEIGEIPFSASVFSPRIVASYEKPTIFYLSSERILKVSFNEGDSWHEFTLPDAGYLYPSVAGSLYFSTRNTLYKSIDFGENWAGVQDHIIARSFTQIARLHDNLILASTETDGIYSSDDSGKTWKQTSIGPDVTILDLTITERDHSRVAVAIANARHRHEFMLIKSTDGITWQTEPLPCEQPGRYLGYLIKTDNSKSWQIKCETSSKILVVNAADSQWYEISFPATILVINARVESKEEAYILTQSRLTRNLHMTDDGGKTWLSSDGLLNEYSWSLSQDLRSEAILIAHKQGQAIASFRPHSVTSLTTLFAGSLYLLIPLLLMIRPKVLASIWTDFMHTLRWTFRSAQIQVHRENRANDSVRQHLESQEAISAEFPGIKPELSNSFWLVGCVTILLTSVVIVQSASAESVIATTLDQVSRNVIVYYVERALAQVPIPLTTPTGYKLLATLITIVLGTSAIVFLMSSASNIVTRFTKRQDTSDIPVVAIAVKQSMPTLLIGTLMLSLLGAIPISTSNLLWFNVNGVFALVSLFFFYRFATIALNVIALRKAISKTWLAITYLLLVFLLSVVFQVAIDRFQTNLTEIVHNIVTNNSLSTFVFVNFLIIILYVWRSE